MLNWLRKILGIRPTFGRSSPIIPRKARLSGLDRRIAAAREIDPRVDDDICSGVIPRGIISDKENIWGGKTSVCEQSQNKENE